MSKFTVDEAEIVTGPLTVTAGDVILTAGNVTLANLATVDGRDASVDGTKLDTIETNATNAGLGVLLATANASASATVEFIDGTGGVVLDSTYKLYIARIINMVPATDAQDLWLRLRDTTFQADAGDYEHDSNYFLGGFQTLTNSTSDIKIRLTPDTASNHIGNVTDEGLSGLIYIADPAATSLIKQIWSQLAYKTDVGRMAHGSCGGMYKSNTNAIDGLQFLMSSGNITSGEFQLYGIL